MNIKQLSYLAVAVLLAGVHAAVAQTSAFTYQGQLTDNGSPADGSYSLRFILYNAEFGGSQVGPTLTNEPVSVANGLFTTTLDFGAVPLNGSPRWLEVAVRTNGGASVHQPLSPRQALTSAPYAFYAANAGTASSVTGTVSSAVTFNNAANSFNGSFSGNGGGLTNVNAATLGGIAYSNFWQTTGNSGANSNWYLGTADYRPLELRVNGQRAVRLEPVTDGAANTIIGAEDNTVWPGVRGGAINGGVGNAIGDGTSNTILLDESPGAGAVIGGGYGNTLYTNASFGVIGGGRRNQIRDGTANTIFAGESNVVDNATGYSVIGGGFGNTNSGAYAVVPGGWRNSALGDYSYASGRRARANHPGSFVWADSQNADFNSTSNNQFNVRADGSVRFVTSGAGMTLDGQPVLAGTVGAGQLSGIYSNAVTFNNSANNFNGVFTGNGAGLTGLNASSLSSGVVADARIAAAIARDSEVLPIVLAGDGPGSGLNADLLDGLSSSAFWQLGGNAGTTAGTHFLGTTDDESLEFKVNGQRGLRIEPNANGAPNLIGGSANNLVDAGVVGAFIGGGGATNFSGTGRTNRIASSFGAIGGGFDNLINTNARAATISGGQENMIQSGVNSTIGGGQENLIQSAGSATIAGGQQNTMTNATWSFIGGGFDNRLEGSSGAIASGLFNEILSQSSGFIGGGALNQLGGTNHGGSSTGVSNVHNAIAGGVLNWIAEGAAASFIGGGRNNFISNGVSFATVPGGQDNRAAGDYSFAAGRRAKADHDGALVWADAQNADFRSTDTNQFLIRASGGVGIGTNNPASTLHVNGTARVDGHTTIGALFALSRVVVAPAGNSTLTPTSSYLLLNPAASVILSATTAITNGSTPGDVLILEGTSDVQTVTINDAANTSLAAATRTLGNDDTLMLLWNGSQWIEISFSNN